MKRKNNFQDRISLMISSPSNVAKVLRWFLPESGDYAVERIEPIYLETFFFAYTVAELQGRWCYGDETAW